MKSVFTQLMQVCGSQYIDKLSISSGKGCVFWHEFEEQMRFENPGKTFEFLCELNESIFIYICKGVEHYRV